MEERNLVTLPSGREVWIKHGLQLGAMLAWGAPCPEVTWVEDRSGRVLTSISGHLSVEAVQRYLAHW
jgi:hypothetical protein